ncbi:MAG: glutamate 5-kinase [Cryomorphaceae bacterium]|jgi:glutamate 5-kinase
MSKRGSIKSHKRWVVKVGSALLTNDGQGLDQPTIEALAEQVAYLRSLQIEVVLVSSGSVAAGVSQLGLKSRPERMAQLQAAAAVGQASLVRHYEDAFKPFGINIAQVLLTHADIANRARYLNARGTLKALLDLKVLTVVNENDTVATDEIAFGDNDNLGALVANLVDADLLVILTDQNGLYTADPRSNPDAELLHEVDANDSSLRAMAKGGSGIGRGGMITKLVAAQTASRSGASTIIAHGRELDVLKRLHNGETLGTLLTASNRLASRKQWMAGQMKISGTVTIDDGASKVLQQAGKSLLAVGVVALSGKFQRGELISCLDASGNEIARGLSNYDAAETEKIMGQSSKKIVELLGYGSHDELIHRDNLVLL